MSTDDGSHDEPDEARSLCGLAWGIPLGLIAGAGVGLLFDKLALGAGIGMLAGIVIGTILDQRRSSSSH